MSENENRNNLNSLTRAVEAEATRPLELDQVEVVERKSPELKKRVSLVSLESVEESER